MNGTVLTRKGLQLIAKLVASGNALTFTRAAVGIGSVPSGYDPGSMTGLNNYKMDGIISACSASEDEASVVFQISSVGVETGFTVTEAGLFATDPDEGEILYAYLDMSSDPQYIYAANSAISKFVEMTLTVKVGTVESVTTFINPGSLVKKAEFDSEMAKKVDLDGGELKDTVVEFEDYTGDTEVPAAATALENIKSKGKLATLLSNIKAFCKGCVTLAMLVNNTATNNSQLPVSSAVTHDLQEQLNVLNTKTKVNIKILNNSILTEQFDSEAVVGTISFFAIASSMPEESGSPVHGIGGFCLLYGGISSGYATAYVFSNVGNIYIKRKTGTAWEEVWKQVGVSL